MRLRLRVRELAGRCSYGEGMSFVLCACKLAFSGRHMHGRGLLCFGMGCAIGHVVAPSVLRGTRFFSL